MYAPVYYQQIAVPTSFAADVPNGDHLGLYAVD
jgi:hypothetical protein